jgi:hypothetical protein
MCGFDSDFRYTSWQLLYKMCYKRGYEGTLMIKLAQSQILPFFKRDNSMWHSKFGLLTHLSVNKMN